MEPYIKGHINGKRAVDYIDVLDGDKAVGDGEGIPTISEDHPSRWENPFHHL